MRTICAIAFVLVLVGSAVGQSQPPPPSPTKGTQYQQTKPASASDNPKQDDRGGDKTPLVVTGQISATVVGKVTTATDAAEADEHRRESEQETTRKNIELVVLIVGALLTTALTAITGFLACYTRNLWKWTARLALDAKRAGRRQDANTQAALIEYKRSADAAERAIVAANRAWLKVDFSVVGPITFENEEVRIPLSCAVTNVGNSPATHVLLQPGMTDKGTTAARNLLEGLIRKARVRPNDEKLGFAVFSGDTVHQPFFMCSGGDTLRVARAEGGAFYPIVVGVVGYRIGLDDSVRVTGFMFAVGRKDTPRPFTDDREEGKQLPREMIWIDEGTVPADEVVLMDLPYHGGFAD